VHGQSDNERVTMSSATSEDKEGACGLQRARTSTPPLGRALQRRRHESDADDDGETEALVDMVLGSIPPLSDW
jgi:hypothetical protein